LSFRCSEFPPVDAAFESTIRVAVKKAIDESDVVSLVCTNDDT
jgi:hypothetical protein